MKLLKFISSMAIGFTIAIGATHMPSTSSAVAVAWIGAIIWTKIDDAIMERS